MINCPGTCSSRYLVGTVVNLTATPPSDSEFVGWTGDIVSSDNPLAVTVTGVDKTINAVFNLKPILSITESGDGTGTVTSDVGGISCPGTCSHAYLTGTVVNLTATPIGSSFLGWTGVPVGHEMDNPVEVTVSANMTVNAQFELNVGIWAPRFSISGITANTTTAPFLSPMGSTNSDETLVQYQMPEGDFTIISLAALLISAPGTGKSVTFTVRKNGADTGLAVTISGSSLSGLSIGSVSFAQDDLISYHATFTGGLTTIDVASISFAYTTVLV